MREPSRHTSASDVSYVGRVRGYRDITEGTNLDAPSSYTRGHNDAGPDSRPAATRSTQTYIRPLRRAIYRKG